MFSRTHFKRLAGTSVALVLLTGVLTGTAIAKPPDFSGDAPPSPAFVTHGGQVMFAVSWTNNSGANLPTVNMTAQTPSGAEFLTLLDGSPSQGECSGSAGLLTCAFGTVNAGASVSFDAVYRVPSSGSAFSVDFVFTAQGSTQNDNPKKSRGDDMPVTGTVALAAAGSDRAGSFIYGNVETLENNQVLHKQRNPQAARLDFSDSTGNFGATLDEEPPVPCPSAASTCHGTLTVLSVANGNSVSGGFFVTLGYFQVPGTAQGGIIHWLDGGGFNLIEPGDTSPGYDDDPEYLFEVKKTNGNTFYTVFTDTNGKMGGY